MTTRAQTRTWQLHKALCLGLGIPQSTLNHKKLKGSFDAPSPTGNRIYRGPPPSTAFAPELVTAVLVWFVYQPFVRGEQRPDQYAPAIIATPQEQGQFAAIDDLQNLILVSEDDFVTTPEGTIYRITNPVLSPDQSFWTFMIAAQR